MKKVEVFGVLQKKDCKATSLYSYSRLENKVNSTVGFTLGIHSLEKYGITQISLLTVTGIGDMI